jgi:uncharacterized membrane protein
VYPPRKLGLYSVGLIVLIFGIVLFIIGFVDDRTLQSSQISMGSVLILILGIILLWSGGKTKGTNETD